MKVCPQCGFVDPPCWKHSRWGWDKQQDYCKLEIFEDFYPDLAIILKEKGEVRDSYYFYKLSKKGYVYRLALIDEDFYHSHGYAEHPQHKDNSQTKLTDVLQ